MEICVGRYGPCSWNAKGAPKSSIVFRNAKNRGDQYITLAMSLMAVYNEGFPQQQQYRWTAISRPNIRPLSRSLAFIVLFVYDGDATERE